MNHTKKIAASAFAVISSFYGSTVAAEELDAIFKKVNEYVQQQNYPKAIEELSWAKQEIEKKNSQKLQTFFPDDVLGYKGDKTDINNALGFVNVERKYKGEKGIINASLTGGSGGSGGALGGLAQFGKMAAMFGAQGGQETVRISGRTATIEKQPGSKSASISIFLDSGSVLKVESQNSQDTDALKSFAEALKIDEIDKYLKG